MFRISYLFVLFVMISCSSFSDKVVSTMEDKERPSWATQEKVVNVKDGTLHILGFQELDVSAKISSAFRMSDNAARNELSKLIENQFSSIFQNLEEGVEDSGGLVRFYSSEVTKNVLRDFKIKSRFWEKIKTIDSDGNNNFRLRVYSLAEIPESNYKKMIKEKVYQQNLDPAVKNQVLNHFESEIKALQAN